jgi:hypothetical protein
MGNAAKNQKNMGAELSSQIRGEPRARRKSRRFALNEV